MPNISPGVYTKIIDLSTYVTQVESTTGLICALTKKGEDNKIRFIESRSELISEFGEPNISDYGKHYGQGLYMAYNYLGESGSLYFMRCLPGDAAFANMRVDAEMETSDSSANVSITYINDINTTAEIQSNLAQDGDTKPICFLYPIGRGEYYNGLGVRFTAHSNPLQYGVYVMDIYERQTDGDDVIIESFEVSFDPNAVDNSGDSIWITYILEIYSSVLRAEMTLASGEYTSGYELISKIYDKDIGTVSAVTTALSASITDNKQNFTDWENDTETGNANYVVIAIDAKGNKLYGWLGAATGDDSSINVFNGRDLDTAARSWIGTVASFDTNSSITYLIKESYSSVSDAFTSSEPAPLKKGSDGSLLDASGDLDTTEATELLANGYAGVIDDTILDTEDIYFTVVFDCGYPLDVKTQISTLVQTREDCIALLDIGDNSSYTAGISSRENTYTFNNYYCALYENYNKVYDTFTGQDVWFSPLYHMSYLLPRNDQIAQPWFAVAGFNRASIDSIKEIRYNPRLAQRDQLYLKQINSIVKFSQGYTVWGQLTSQSKASALQDLNVVRLVLYCKRALEQFCSSYIFEQNDAITWGQVSSEIVDFLEQIKNLRGLDAYTVTVYATDYMKKTKTFAVDVTLTPTKVAEKIELNFFIK